MKSILLLFAIFISTNSVAQDSQLFDNDWYLYNAIINGENNTPPNNGEVTSVPLFFFGTDNFETDVCNYLSGTITFDDATSSFTFTEMVQSLAVCNISENGDFENLYFHGIYFTNQEYPFTYTIVQNLDTSKTLTITGANGDYAIYGNALLDVKQHKISEIKLFPNPVINSVTIDKTNDISNLKLTVFNVHGQLKLTKNINVATINVTNLESGIYFFVFETKDGRSETKKIIKQ